MMMLRSRQSPESFRYTVTHTLEIKFKKVKVISLFRKRKTVKMRMKKTNQGKKL